MSGHDRPKVFCAECRHRGPPALKYVGGQTEDLEIIDEDDKFADWQAKKLFPAEQSREQTGEPFPAIPQYYEWCEAWSAKTTANAHPDYNGRRHPVFEICAVRNRDHDCSFYEPLPGREYLS